MAGRVFLTSLASLALLLALTPLISGIHLATTSLGKVYPMPTTSPTLTERLTHGGIDQSKDGNDVSRSILDDPDPVCHMQCHPVKHDIMVDAANWFCDEYDQSVLETSADNRFGRYYYEPATTAGTPGTYDEGVVVMQIMVTPGTDCDPVIVITKEACISWLYRTINLCPSWWFGAIRGGNITTGCLTYDITPSYYHFPICWTDDCIHNSGWPEAEKRPRPDVTFNTGPSSDFAVVESHQSLSGPGPDVISQRQIDAADQSASTSKMAPDTEVTSPTPIPSLNHAVARANNQTGRTGFSDVDIAPTCYERCYGIDRSNAMAGIQWMCNIFSGHIFTAPADNVSGNWTYTPDEEADRFCTCWEEGNIFMRIDVTEGDGCSPPFTADFDFCYDHFRTIIDGCNTGGENGKQGGELIDGCIKWSIDPNPWFSPKCWMADCTHWFSCAKRPPTL